MNDFRAAALFAAFLCATALLPGCVVVDATINGVPDGERVAISHRVDDVVSVSFRARGELRIVQGSATGLVIEGNEHLVPLVDVRVSGDTLVIVDRDLPVEYDLDFGSWMHQDPRSSIDYVLTLPVLERLELGSHARLEIDTLTATDLAARIGNHSSARIGNLDVGTLDLSIANHATLEVVTLDTDFALVDVASHGDAIINRVQGLELHVDLAGHADARAAGRIDVQRARVQGHASWTARDLMSNVAHVDVASHGFASVFAVEELYTQIAKHGDLDYYGEPELHLNSGRIAARQR